MAHACPRPGLSVPRAGRLARGLAALCAAATLLLGAPAGAAPARPAPAADEDSGPPVPPVPELGSPPLGPQPRRVAVAAALLPGLGHLMQGEQALGLGILGGTAGLVAGGLALGGPRALLPGEDGFLLMEGANALWLWSVWDAYQRARLQRARAGPGDSFPYQTPGELLSAPFQPEVLARPTLLLPLLAVLGMAVAGLPLSDSGSLFAQDRVPVLGRSTAPGWALVANGAAFGVLSMEAAVGEEAVFRGFLLHGMTDPAAPAGGIALQALLFGLLHVPNPFLYQDGADVEDGLKAGALTGVLGAHLGYLTWDARGDLRPAVAFHFWYDLLLLGFSYVSRPQEVPFRLQIAVPF